MEKYIRYGFRAEQVPNYSCSVVNMTKEQWYAEGQVSYPLGIGFLTYGITTEIVYAFVMTSMWRLRKSNLCYTFMLLLGIYDMLAIGVNSLVTGVLWFIGGCYCTAPDLTYITGCLAVGLWCGACLCCFILVLNRIFDLWNPFFNDKIFGGYFTYVWVSLPIFYTLYFIFYTPPALFNSKMTAWFFSPFITRTEEEMAMFYNYPHTINNLSVVVVTCFLYVVLSLLLAHKYSIGGISNISKVQRSIMLQSTLICLANLIASLIYVYMQFFVIPIWLILVGHMCWQAGHGIPAYVYLLLNKTIRSDIKRIFHVGRSSAISNATYSANRLSSQERG